MTNLERIKNMSIEEMAVFIYEVSNCETNNCSFCPIQGGCGSSNLLEKWLESEVEK